MIDLLMDITDLARVRFARSPMDELVHSVAVLGGRSGGEMHRTWVTTTRPRLAGLDLRVLAALAGLRGFLPDFLMPPPTSSRTTFEHELERVRGATAEQVRRDLDRVKLPEVLRPLRDDPDRELGNLADQLRAYWEAALAPVWDRLCAVYDADLGHRAAALTDGGLARLFTDLHPQVGYSGDRLRIQLGAHDHVHEVKGLGVQLMPCVFLWPGLTVCDADPYQPAITYPPRGVGQVWATTPETATLAELIGRGRAALLAVLDLPRSTRQLAADLGVAPSTVSEHLAILRRTQLVRSHRSGRAVLYERTPLADQLLAQR